MKISMKLSFILLVGLLMTSCVSKKKYVMLEEELATEKSKAKIAIDDCNDKLTQAEDENSELSGDLKSAQSTLALRQEQISDLKSQIEDIKKQRDKQLEQVEGLTKLSSTANKNIQETLAQIEKKDKYISLLQAARNRTDSINLALAVNLKSALAQGLDDKDIDVSVDKTVVMINLSGKMLYKSGSSTITSEANAILAKIALIIQDRPGLDVLVEGHTDDKPISKGCIKDNWDLSCERATAVVRALQEDHGVAPERLIAAGRSEYIPLASNGNKEGREINRRTRIIIMPKLDEFYDLLDPTNVK